MKKLFSLFLIGTLITSYAQERYSYVLIPRTFAGFKNQEDNPYGLSSNIHYLLAKRHIKTYYEGKEDVYKRQAYKAVLILYVNWYISTLHPLW